MKRGKVWTVAGGPDYAGKPRPAVILQDDAFDATVSITICPFTTHSVDAPLVRLPIDSSDQNGLRVPASVPSFVSGFVFSPLFAMVFCCLRFILAIDREVG